MATYTGIADANGDFTVSFGTAKYTSGEKITVTAEKDSAEKSIELYAPTGVVGGGVIQFSGSLIDFPLNIGVVTISGISGAIAANAFRCSSGSSAEIFKTCAKGLIIGEGVTSLSINAFMYWQSAEIIDLPSTLSSAAGTSLANFSACDVVICRAVTPPSIINSTFQSLKSTCVFKVPVESVAAYQAAPIWSAFASRIQAI